MDEDAYRGAYDETWKLAGSAHDGYPPWSTITSFRRLYKPSESPIINTLVQHKQTSPDHSVPKTHQTTLKVQRSSYPPKTSNMKAISISMALALLTSMVSAAPAPAAASPPYQIEVKFIGAAEGQFTQYFLTNGYGSGIYNPLSVSKINNPGGATCYFYGVDGSQTTVPSGATVDVGPPQQQSYGYCYAY
ncbi:MAG: hypothetical protein LQ338_005822 [Usnochroma carphineum]|nr:MAG: hypothetical protein LQ338_005822 [Usnochroma carphineum]